MFFTCQVDVEPRFPAKALAKLVAYLVLEHRKKEEDMVDRSYLH